MNKFKVGDKVLTPFGVGTLIEELEDLGYGLSVVEFGNSKGSDYNFELQIRNEDLKPYKTPHEILIELGWVALNETGRTLTYLLNVNGSLHPQRIELSLEGKSFYTTLRFINLELAEILVDYLKENRK